MGSKKWIRSKVLMSMLAAFLSISPWTPSILCTSACSIPYRPPLHLLHKSEYNQIKPDFIQFFFAMTLKDRALNIALIPSYKSGARLFFSRASWRGNYVFHVSEYHFQLLIITELGVTAFDLKMAISKKASFYWQEDATPQVTAHELKRALLLREWFPQFYSPV